MRTTTQDELDAHDNQERAAEILDELDELDRALADAPHPYQVEPLADTADHLLDELHALGYER